MNSRMVLVAHIQGMLFMLPVTKGKVAKGKKDVWLPVWGWVEADWGTFNFNAEWQGPIPGMKAYVQSSCVVAAFPIIYMHSCSLAVC